MGFLCCGQTQEGFDKDKEISKLLKADKMKSDSEIKLLLLGAGESGKSTIFKQMKIIHKNGYTAEECKKFKDIIHGNILQSIRVLCNAMCDLEISYEDEEVESFVDEILDISEQEIILNASSVFTPELSTKIKRVWKNKGVQKAFDRKNEFQLNDSADYYLNDIDRISTPDYKPTQQDVLRSRVKTVGIVETDFVIDKYKFKMVDVGGQRNERRKWIHVFDDVTAIIFVTSLSEYDQTLFEDDSMNRMRESLVLFNEICNCRFFRSTSIIIFFNKKDLFEKKIAKTDLKVCFEEYTGGCNYKAALDFIKERFLEINKSRHRQLYTHVTCATDTENIRVVFDAVKDIILHDNLRDANLL